MLFVILLSNCYSFITIVKKLWVNIDLKFLFKYDDDQQWLTDQKIKKIMLLVFLFLIDLRYSFIQQQNDVQKHMIIWKQKHENSWKFIKKIRFIKCKSFEIWNSFFTKKSYRKIKTRSGGLWLSLSLGLRLSYGHFDVFYLHEKLNFFDAVQENSKKMSNIVSDKIQFIKTDWSHDI